MDLAGPDLQPAGGARVIAPPQLRDCPDQLLLPLQTGHTAADEFLAVVEGERFLVLQAGVGLPVLDEGLGLLDLAGPLPRRPGADSALASAEVAVEVGSDLIAVQPGAAELLHRGLDALDVVEADGRGAAPMSGRIVEVPLLGGQQVHTAEKVRHRRAVPPADRAEVGEQLLFVLPGAVPGEDDELRWPLARFKPLGLRLMGLGARVGGRSVADEPYRPRGLVRVVRPTRAPLRAVPVVVRARGAARSMGLGGVSGAADRHGERHHRGQQCGGVSSGSHTATSPLASCCVQEIRPDGSQPRMDRGKDRG